MEQARLLQFLKDGNQLLLCRRDGVVQVLDASTGKEIRRFGKAVYPYLAAVSADGTIVAVGTPGSPRAGETRGAKVHIWNVATGKETCSFHLGFRDLSGLTFVDAKRLIGWSSWRTAKVWDTGTGKVTRVLVDDPAPVNGVGYGKIIMMSVSPDGKTLAFTSEALKGKDGNANLYVWDLTGTEPRREIVANSNNLRYASPDFSRDSRYSVLPQADGTIQLYRSPSFEKVRVLGEPSKDGRVQSTSFSPDGKMLAAVTQSGRIHLLDIATGKKLREIGEKSPRYARAWEMDLLAWTPNSKRIAQPYGPGIVRVWATETGEGTDPGKGHIGPVTGLAISGDGKNAVTLGDDFTTRIWDVRTATERRRVSLPPDTNHAQLIGINRAVLLTKEGSLSVWDVERKKELVSIREFKEPLPTLPFNISRDGKFLLTREDGGATTQYDLETGATLRGIEKRWTNNSKEREEEFISLVRGARYVLATIWSRDRELRCIGPNEPWGFMRFKKTDKDSVVFWERKQPDFNITEAISFTPDDRAILVTNNDRDKRTWVTLLESVTGKERCRFVIPMNRRECVHAFSKSGNLMAVATNDGTTAVFDVRRAKEVVQFNGDQGSLRALAFGAEETLLTAGSDGTVLIWDLREPIRKVTKAVVISPEEGNRLWTELADAETVKAYRAVADLLNAPEQAVELLRKKLKPVEKVPAAEIEKLIADLGSANFTTREKALAGIRRIGTQAKSPLNKSLEKLGSLEQRRRVAELLEEMTPVPLGELREQRAVEVLEVVGTPAARSILESLAKGAPDISLTEEATLAVKRLKNR